MIKKIRLKGLKALIPIKVDIKPKKKKENVFYVEIKKIRQTHRLHTSAGQAKEVDKKILKDLTESIKKYGVIQPLTLAKIERKKKGGINVYYRLISGQKRLIAAKSAGLRVVPAKIKNDKV